jgi:hypothetical protein
MANIDTDVLAGLIWAQVKNLVPDLSTHDAARVAALGDLATAIAATLPDSDFLVPPRVEFLARALGGMES